MLHLKVDIDYNSGFCFGVVYAVDMAEEILEQRGYLYCLGDIVHNDEEVQRLQAKGLRIINNEDLQNLYNETVLIRAHGEPPATYQTALNNNIELIDASCPVVLKLQNRIKKSYDNGAPIFIYGKEGHAEVVGLKGQTNNEAVVFADVAELSAQTVPQHITLYSQTTKSAQDFYNVRHELEQNGVTVDFKDTICRQVSNRDQELQQFARQYDVVIFVSGSKSSNGKMLYKVCQQNNPNSYFVSGVNDIDAQWFSAGQTVGICGATSTPMWLMENVQQYLQAL